MSRAALIALAVLLATVGPLPALLPLAAAALAHVLRSPDRLLDAAYVAAFCALGYFAG